MSEIEDLQAENASLATDLYAVRAELAEAYAAIVELTREDAQ